MMNNQPRRSRGMPFLVGAVVGTAVGAALGILFAPAPGKETRRQVKKKAGELKAEGEKIYQETIGPMVEEAARGAAVQAKKTSKQVEKEVAKAKKFFSSNSK